MSVVVLTGGVGGAKLVDGLARMLPDTQLTAIVNTADDFTHLGLRICPDLDSVLYMLCGKSDPVRGWGVMDESWNFMAALAEWGGENWFNLGDRDLAMHVLRSAALARGESLATFTARMARTCATDVTLLPMSEDPVSTVVESEIGSLPFQHYFVKHQCKPVVKSIRFDGVAQARALPQALEALSDPALSAILIAPSNPYLSVDPILAVPEIADRIVASSAPTVAVSPIIRGKALKGPTAKLMGELGLEIGNRTIADHYGGIIDGLLIDRADAAVGSGLPIATKAEDILMRSAADRARVARAALDFAGTLGRTGT